MGREGLEEEGTRGKERREEKRKEEEMQIFQNL
jgi:hypothetical protein